MEDQKQYCEKLYQEYKELKRERNRELRPEKYEPGEKVKAASIPLRNWNRFYEVKKELKEKCKPFLNISQSEWFKIEDK